MKALPPIAKVIDYFKSLPGVGPRMAERMTYHIIKNTPEYVRGFSEALSDVKETIRYCAACRNFSTAELCSICSDPMREHDTICVVEDVQDLLAIQKARHFAGVFHVLHGSLSPLEGIGPEDLTIPLLVERIRRSPAREVIIATNPNIEGEATATYISQALKPLGVRVTRLGQGIPRGGDLEYLDGYTLKKAFESRRDM